MHRTWFVNLRGPDIRVTTSIEALVGSGALYDENIRRDVIVDFENAARLAETLEALGASECVLLVYEGRATDTVMPLLDGIEHVRRSKGPAAISCLPGDLAYCKDASGSEVILSRRVHANEIPMSTPLRIILATVGAAMSVVGVIGLASPSVGRSLWMHNPAPGLVGIALGALMCTSAWRGHDKVGRRRPRNDAKH